jgi:hypothetical protein
MGSWRLRLSLTSREAASTGLLRRYSLAALAACLACTSNGSAGTGGGDCPGLSCPAGCSLAVDCSTCVPASLHSGLATTCMLDADCCTGVCDAGLCVPAANASTSTTGAMNGAASTSGQSATTTSGGGASTSTAAATTASTSASGTTGSATAATASGSTHGATTTTTTTSGGSLGSTSGGCAVVGAACSTGGAICCSQYCIHSACTCNSGGGTYPCVAQTDCCTGATCTAGLCQ